MNRTDLDKKISLPPVKIHTRIFMFNNSFEQVGVSILIATHDLTLIARMKYRIITLVKGRIVGIEDNNTEDISDITDSTEINTKETETL